MSAQDTLQQAKAVLGMPDAFDSSHEVWARSAALLTRQALEEALAERMGSKLNVHGDLPFTTQLILLREAVDAEQANGISYVWSALSSATHMHGYALPPTVEELRRWFEAVERFVALQ